MQKLIGCIRKANSDFDFFKPNDKIAVGISGGKDSIALLYALHLYIQSAKLPIEIIGVHIEMGFANMDFTALRSFCQEKNISYVDVPSQIYEILQLHTNKDNRISCSLCSKFKKAAINEAATKLGCNKVAFAHHADDAVETLFMNAIHGGRLATFAPQMYLENANINFIRPLIYAHEDQIIDSVKRNNLPVVHSTCPNDGNSERSEIKNMLNSLYDEYPMAKNNFLRMLSNTEQLSLWDLDKRGNDYGNQ